MNAGAQPTMRAMIADIVNRHLWPRTAIARQVGAESNQFTSGPEIGAMIKRIPQMIMVIDAATGIQGRITGRVIIAITGRFNGGCGPILDIQSKTTNNALNQDITYRAVCL